MPGALYRRGGLAALIALCAACASAPPPRAVRVKIAPRQRVEGVMPLVQAASRRHGVPPALILGVIQVESSFRPEVCSHAGACGLMQLMPRTAASLARRLAWEDHDVADPAFNIEAGTAYLAWLNTFFKGDLRLALAGYNAGPMRVRRWQRAGRPLPRQVSLYAARVLAARDRFARQLDAGTPVPEPEPERAQALAVKEEPELDRGGLRELIKAKEQLYGPRPDAPLPDEAPATQPPLTPRTPATEALEAVEATDGATQAGGG